MIKLVTGEPYEVKNGKVVLLQKAKKTGELYTVVQTSVNGFVVKEDYCNEQVLTFIDLANK